ncbi:hypothetical protein GA0074695_4250 [Micromonospora viridifaciens]|uniref:Uncharacterized protein n=1 Tax=Micromonospora viridifaciens TaxID=1881 RepID=A0A1C4YGA8_MICVI|nr:hypothetical protein [Micromonospora viridifaciens]SCF19759.1 hypothetical protein GA0074695_4250 [Micromonospora viridifaciens]
MTTTAAAGGSLVQQFLGLVAGAVQPDPRPSAPQEPVPVLAFDEQIALLVRQLDHLLEVLSPLPGAPPDAVTRLQLLRDEIATWREGRLDPTLFALGEEERLAKQVLSTSTMVQIAAPSIMAAAQLAAPGRWLRTVQEPLATEAGQVVLRYVEAIGTTWRSGALAGLAAADEAMRRFPKMVCQHYLGLPALKMAIDGLGDLRDNLLILKAASQHPTSGTPALDDMQLKAVADQKQTWGPLWQLRKDLTPAEGAYSQGDYTRAYPLIIPLAERIQAYQLILTALLIDEQLATFVDELVLAGDLRARLGSHRATLAGILAVLHEGFTGKAGRLAAGGGQLSNLLRNKAFTDDFDAAVDRLKNQDMVKTTALVVAVAVAAAVAGIAAAAVAEVAIVAIAGQAVAGTAWVAVGGFAADVMASTVVDRLGREILMGEESLAGSSAFGDLLWNAASAGLLRGVGNVYGNVFRGANVQSMRFRLGKAGTDFVTMTAFGQVQQLARTGELMGVPEIGESLVQQVAVTAVMWVGTRLASPARSRLGGVAKAADQAEVNAADAGADAVAKLINRINRRTATPAEREGLATLVQEQYNREVRLARSVPDGTPDKAEVLAAQRQMIGELELRLALAGMESALGGPDAPSRFGPVQPGVVAFADEARPIAEHFEADRGAPALAKSPAVEGALEAAHPDGTITTYLPAERLDVPSPPKPPRIGSVRARLELQAVTESGGQATLADIAPLAEIGLTNLEGWFAENTVNKIVDWVEGEHQLGFLQFMSHPEFAPPGPNEPRRTFAAGDLQAFGQSREARDFANAYGPGLALHINLTITDSHQKNSYPKHSLAGLRRAAAEIEAAAPAERAAVIEKIRQRTKKQWDLDLGVKVPPPPRPAPATAANLGIDKRTAMWRGILELHRKRYDTKTAPEIEALAEIEMVMERGRQGHFKKLSHKDRIEVLAGFADRCLAAGLAKQVNGKLGALNEYMFLDEPFKKTFWLNGKQERANQAGGTVPDAYWDEQRRMLELKATRFDTLKLSDLSDRARQHTDDITGVYDAQGNLKKTGDAHNMPPGTTFDIWYTFEANEAQIKVMMDEFQRPGSKVTRVRFGSGGWLPVIPRSQ